MNRPLARFVFLFGQARNETGNDGVAFWPHLQKYSRAGVMINIVPRWWPVIVHVWFFWKKQTIDIYGTNLTTRQEVYTPGSEQGIYARSPGFREGKDGLEFTKGYIGLHWD